MIERVKNQELLSASKENDHVDQTNVLGSGGMVGSGTQGPTGQMFEPGPDQPLGLFVLLSNINYPADTGKPYTQADPTAYASAARLDFYQANPADVIAANSYNSPVYTYNQLGTLSGSQAYTLYFPLCPRTANGYSTMVSTNNSPGNLMANTGPWLTYDVPPALQGDRVYGIWNRQSGRWEALPNPTVPRTIVPVGVGVLSSTLQSTDQVATVQYLNNTWTALNLFGDASNSGSAVLLIPNPSYSANSTIGISGNTPYIVGRVACQPITVVTGMNWNITAGQLIQQAATIMVPGVSPTPVGPTTVLTCVQQQNGNITGTTATAVQASPTTITFGQDIQFTATVAINQNNGNATPSGSINWYWLGPGQAYPNYFAYGPSPLSGNTATVNLSQIPSGWIAAGNAFSLVAVYGGDQYYSGSQGSASFNIQPTNTTVQVINLQNPSVYGNTYGGSTNLGYGTQYVYVMVNGALSGLGTPYNYLVPQGSVVVDDTYNGNTTNSIATVGLSAYTTSNTSNSLAVVTLPKLPAGSHSLTFRFVPSGSVQGLGVNSSYLMNTPFLPSNTTVSLNITPRPCQVVPLSSQTVYGLIWRALGGDINYWQYTWSNLASGEANYGPAGLTNSPSPTSNATNTSPIGTYSWGADVSKCNSPNYTFTAGPANTLTVVPYPVTVQMNNVSGYKGGSVPAFGSTITGLQNGDTMIVDGNCPPFTEGGTISNTVTVGGSYTVYPVVKSTTNTANGDVSNCYVLTLKNAALTIRG